MSKDTLLLGPYTRAAGSVALPGSKSISNRTLLLAALCEGETVVKNLLKSDDTDVMLAALDKLGVRVEALGGSDYRVHGCKGDFPVKAADLFLGNAGTAFRPLTAVLAFQGGTYQLDGVPRMRERPISDLVEALRQVPCEIDYLQGEGFPPLRIRPAKAMTGKVIEVRGATSSQFLSALLMTAPLWAKQAGEVRVRVIGELISKPYVEITLNLLARFGIDVQRVGAQEFAFQPTGNYLSPGTISVEGDASTASYFLAAGAIGGGPVRVTGVGQASIQGDVRFAEALFAMGAKIEMGEDWIEASGNGKLKAIDADFNHIPDAAMTIAVLALFADGTTTLRNIASWRVKETDRIAAMAAELRKFGATVEEGADYIRVTPPAKLASPSAAIATYDDHRMAMCFSLPTLAGISVPINDPGCVAKTFPGYFDQFRAIAS